MLIAFNVANFTSMVKCEIIVCLANFHVTVPPLKVAFGPEDNEGNLDDFYLKSLEEIVGNLYG